LYPSSAVLSRSRFFQRPFWHIAMPCGEDGNHPISRNCLSNIHAHGMTIPAGASKLAWLMQEARRLGLTGVGLKDAAPDQLAGSNTLSLHDKDTDA
ncbi:ethanolamine ammonia-lyase light chain EutC, partial [Acetobacter lovaniensis]|uniref:ethanolamine ammonia-lyase light chain EutC n=1 Tax=Acetobacter lovaniensis TaxID=104100 RepID=UPI00209FC6F4